MHKRNIGPTLELDSKVKKILPKCQIKLGGPEVSYDAEQIITDNPSVDYIILGEGEELLPLLVADITSGKKPTVGNGLVGNQIIAGTPVIVQTLDNLPFPYDDSDMPELKDKIIYYESSRGCPFSCQYCLSSATSGVRFLSRERVQADLDFFLRHGVRQVKFVDRTFNAKRDHYLPILQYLAAADTNTNFHFEIAVEYLDDDVLAFLVTVPVGRFQFEIGVQSTRPETLRAISRHNDWPRIVRSVNTLRKVGNIHLHLDLIAGLPEESYRQFAQSFNDVYALNPHMLQLGFLKLLKGAGIRTVAAQHGYIYMDIAPYEVLGNNYITYAELRKLKIIEDLVDKFHNSGRFTQTMAWIIANYNGDAFAFFQALADIWQQQGLDMVAHSSKTLYQKLDDFIGQTRPEIRAITQEFMKFDALTSEGGTVRPDFLSWNGGAWADEKNAFWREPDKVRPYLPEYSFTTWRDLKKKHHIEVFGYCLPEYLTGKTIVARNTAILFTYQNNAVTYQEINNQDFWTEEK
ncbi:MAG: hypothetical protein H6Q74_3142 [Firmicutes bacterium]|nr:hypothetical protein [Bacillota bacterium]